MFEEWLQFAVAVHREIDAPAQVCWKLLVNMSDLASVFSGVAKVEQINDCCEIGTDTRRVVISGGGLATVGSQWRVHRHLESGERYFSDWTVTKIEDTGPKYPKSIVFYTTGLGEEGAATSTSTWTVQPARDEDGRISCSACRVTMTLAVIPHKFYLIVGRLMCCCVFKQRALASTERDLEDVAIAAKNEIPVEQQ